jgi:hypothetical protein
MKNLCKMIVSYAPVRLLKLQFKRVESQLRSEMKKADAEINEQIALHHESNDGSRSREELLRRHEAAFHHRGFFHHTCESHVANLRAILAELRALKPDECTSNLEEIVEHVHGYWCVLTQRIATLHAELSEASVAEAQHTFQLNLMQVERWLSEAEVNAINLFSNSIASTAEYSIIVEKIRVCSLLSFFIFQN